MWVIGAVGVTLSYRFLVFSVCLKLRLVTRLRGMGWGSCVTWLNIFLISK